MLRGSSGFGIPGKDSAGLLASVVGSLEVVVSFSTDSGATAEVDAAASIGAGVGATPVAVSGVSTDVAAIVPVGTGVAVACCWALLKIKFQG